MARILVVDDESLWRECLRDILQEWGHSVLSADNGCSCLNLLENSEVDIVLTDIFMPGKDGIDLIQELRSRYSHVRIIAMSGGATLLDGRCYLRVANALGASRVLAKPMTGKSLLQAVDETLPVGV